MVSPIKNGENSQEQVDGEATVAWMRRQRWCNGKVGVTGARTRGGLVLGAGRFP